MEGPVTRFHEEQRFHGAMLSLLLAVVAFAVLVAVAAAIISRPDELVLLMVAPLVVVVIALLISTSHLEVDVADDGVTIAFRYLWPTRHISR